MVAANSFRQWAKAGMAAIVAMGPMWMTSAVARELTPQDVVDIGLKQSLGVKRSEFVAMQAEAIAESLRGPYDLNFTAKAYYEYDEALSIYGVGNPVDRTTTISSTLSKRFATGSTLGFEYNRTSIFSTLGSFSPTTSRERANMDTMYVTLRQALWRNFFGDADRATLETADANTRIARLKREESLEDSILNSLSLYWNAYINEIQLRENNAAREKYDELVRAVRRKAGFNLSTPGELPRLEAEFEAADSRVKQSSQQYLASLDSLKTNLQMDPNEAISFPVQAQEVKDIPLVPKLKAIDTSQLRPIIIAQMTMQSAERDRNVAQSNTRPKLDLVAKAGSTGVDENTEQAFSKASSGGSPTYLIGLEFEMAFDSSAFRGIRANAEATYQVANLDFKLAQDSLRDKILSVERQSIANRDSAVSSIEIVNRRAKVVKELEASYRQGRTPLVELIRAFNDLFAAQQERARAVGTYMNSLNEWAAARDELVQTARAGGRG